MIYLGGHFPSQSWTLHNTKWSSLCWTGCNTITFKTHLNLIHISEMKREKPFLLASDIRCYFLLHPCYFIKVGIVEEYLWSLSLWYIRIFSIPIYRLSNTRKGPCEIKRRSITSEETGLLCFGFSQYCQFFVLNIFFSVKGRRNILQASLVLQLLYLCLPNSAGI